LSRKKSLSKIDIVFIQFAILSHQPQALQWIYLLPKLDLINYFHILNQLAHLSQSSLIPDWFQLGDMDTLVVGFVPPCDNISRDYGEATATRPTTRVIYNSIPNYI